MTFLERGEERLSRCVVVAVARAAHALSNAALRQNRPNNLGGVLFAPVGVKDQLSVNLAMIQSHRERTRNRLSSQMVGDRMTNHSARPQVLDRRQIQPSFQRPDVGDV